jgi:hypothetical protein
MPRRAAGRTHRLDSNHQAIVDGLRRIGASVSLISPVDLLVGFRGRNYLLEVKTFRGQTSASQKAFMAAWEGQCSIVRSISEAADVIGWDTM